MKDSLYEVIVYWDKADSIFVVEVPELPGCTAHGRTKAEAMKQAEKAIQLWLSTAKADGIPVPELRGRLIFA
jgi:predicted RNase H-like HicB family nuclease